MVFIDVVFILGVIAVVIYAAARVSPARGQLPAPSNHGVWKTTHYDVKGSTRVVLQKLSTGGAHLLDEHVIATIPLDDPDYDAKFMTAMATARERRALFETEED